MSNIIKTERLLLRPFLPDDAEAAHAWFGDPVVMRYTPGGPDTSIAKTRERLAGYEEHQLAHGFSKWLIQDCESRKPIGDAGLVVLEDLGWIDLGFRLVPACWGRGLATEVTSAWIQRAFFEIGLYQLGAFAHPDNTASIRVLEKLGFRMKKHDTTMGMQSICFTLDRAGVRGGTLPG